MLVVISDLHFVDGTAGEHNVPVEAFTDVFLSSILTLIEREEAKELKVLLLGDVVDLIRTEQWLEADEADRPWGTNGLRDVELARAGGTVSGSNTERLCLEILGNLEDHDEQGNPFKNSILSKNWETFKFFRQDLPAAVRERKQDETFEVELLYVPGNHDRLCNLYPNVRDSLGKMLGLKVPAEATTGADISSAEWWYPHSFLSEKYGVYARHGHEYDTHNYTHEADNTRASGWVERLEQIQVSFGEVFATEFAVKVPWLLRKMHDQHPDADTLAHRMQEMDNIRPLKSVLEYFYHRIEKIERGWAKQALDDAFDRTMKELLENEFLQQWSSPQTKADDALRAFAHTRFAWVASRLLKSSKPEHALAIVQWLTGGPEPEDEDMHLRAAYEEAVREKSSAIRYVLYGHTHSPLMRPMKVSDDRQVTYINTGTWRNQIRKAVTFEHEHTDFIPAKQMTYVVFYGEGEDPGKQSGTVSFDMWTGSKMKITHG